MRFSRFVASAIAINFIGCGAAFDSLDMQSALQSTANIASGNPALPGSDLAKIDLGHAVGAGADLYNAATLSDADVKKIGDQTSSAFDKKNKIAPASSKYAKRLAELTDSFKKEDGLTLNFKAVLTPEINACSFPNGAIRVNSGLMDMMSNDEILAVIGHEIGHIKEGHRKEKLQMAFAAGAARKGVAASNSIAGAVASSEIGGYMESLVNAQFSQSEENQADAYSLDFLARHKFSQPAAVSVMKKFAALGGDHTMLSSHPDPADRAAILAKKIEEQGNAPIQLADNSLDSDSDKAADEVIAEIKASGDSPVRSDEIDPGTLNINVHESNLISFPADEHPVLEKHKATPKRAASSAADKIEKGWYVQIAAETDKETAVGKIGQLRESGDKAHVQRAVVDDTTYFRVLVGPYGTQDDATQRISELGENPLAKGTPFLKRVR